VTGPVTGRATGHIDVHAHVLTDSYRAAWIASGVDRPDGMPAWPAWDAETALGVMDEVGIAASVLSISSPGVHLGEPRATARLAARQNDELSAIAAAHPSRFAFAASLPVPDVGAALAELRRAVVLPGCDAVSLHTNEGGQYLGDPELEPLMAELDRLGSTVIVHPSSPACWEATALGRPRPLMEFLFDTTRAVANLLLNGVLGRYRDITWVVPHYGGTLSVLADRVSLFTLAGLLPDAEADLDVLAELGRLYYDTAGTPFPRVLPAMVSIVGTDRVLYGSDYPFTPAAGVRQAAEVLDAHPLVEEGNRALLRRNAEALFPRLAAAMAG